MSDRSSRNSNVPAILLHVAFLSLDFDDDQLRAAAYDLLGAVYSYLGLEKNPIISYHSKPIQVSIVKGDILTSVNISWLCSGKLCCIR